MVKILILCHPKIIAIENNKITNHWYSAVIQNVLARSKITDLSTVQFETVDIISGGTYKCDCFSEVFAYNKRYDFIFAPDCGGEWYKLQES